MEKMYKVYFSGREEPYGPIIMKNRIQARKTAREYKRIWDIKGTIRKIEYLGKIKELPF